MAGMNHDVGTTRGGLLRKREDPSHLTLKREVPTAEGTEIIGEPSTEATTSADTSKFTQLQFSPQKLTRRREPCPSAAPALIIRGRVGGMARGDQSTATVHPKGAPPDQAAKRLVTLSKVGTLDRGTGQRDF